MLWLLSMEAALFELKRRLRSVWPHLDERTRRLTAANGAMSLGYGGVSLVHRASGLSRKAILKGMREIRAGEALVAGRIRRSGAGRKASTVSDPELLESLDE
ncbi:Rhodopirellula transposase family protein, partial [mine drainage metagenome]